MKPAIVLKPFPYAHDGIHVAPLAKGDSFECQDDVFDRLVEESYIKPAREKPAAADPAIAAAAAAAEAEALRKAAVQIPEKWQEAPDAEKLALAGLIAGMPTQNSGDASSIIAAELARRAAG